MKKLFTLILIFIFIFSFSQKSFALYDVASESSHIEYTLPYPGILPDNPLYFLKAIRDNLLGALITDPVKKAEYDLLMSDKRLGSARSLIDEGKGDLAITTLSKSGNYFHQAVNKIAEAKRQGQDTSSVIDRLLLASQKHQEVIFEMEQKTNGETRNTLLSLEKRAKDFQTMVEVLKSN